MKIPKAAAGAAVVFAAIAAAFVSVALAGSIPSTTPSSAIFVANYFDVTAYAGSTGDIAPVALPTDLADPSGIARDASGRLYVTNRGSNTITVYAANANGSVPPIAVIGGSITKLSSPTGIALDASGAIYVVNNFGNSGSVTMYPPLGKSMGILDEAPVATITGAKTLLAKSSAITVDSQKNIYVANSAGGPVVPKQNFDIGTVTVYAAKSNGNVAPMATVSGAKTGLASPIGIALDSARNIYVANLYTANIGNKLPIGSSITVYAAGSNGNVSPSATIAGSNTGLSYLGGIAIDSSGNLYAGGFSSVNIYAPGSNGNVAPATIISGADTGLGAPGGITLDPARNIYVLNIERVTATAGAETISLPGITVFPATSS
jgi:sugar lactone lactonase YvrE